MGRQADPLVPSQMTPTIPSARESEEIIFRDAPAALRTLDSMGASDLVDILGLGKFVKGGK